MWETDAHASVACGIANDHTKRGSSLGFSTHSVEHPRRMAEDKGLSVSQQASEKHGGLEGLDSKKKGPRDLLGAHCGYLAKPIQRIGKATHRVAVYQVTKNPTVHSEKAPDSTLISRPMLNRNCAATCSVMLASISAMSNNRAPPSKK